MMVDEEQTRAGRVLTLVGKKGGVGKSALATSIASECFLRGLRTHLIDADTNRCCLEWAEEMREEGTEGPAVTAMGEGIFDQLPNLVDAYDITIIDTPGAYDRRLVGALACTDVVLLPYRCSTGGLKVMRQSLKMLRRVQKDLGGDVAEHHRLVAVANFRQNTRASEFAVESMAEELRDAGIRALAEAVPQATALDEAHGQGWHLGKVAPRSPATKSIRAVVDELLKIWEKEFDHVVAA